MSCVAIPLLLISNLLYRDLSLQKRQSPAANIIWSSDEINVAVDFKLIGLKQVVEMIKNKPPALDLILTGRYAAKEIIRLADTVSEVKEIKHHYAAGIKDRAGIEY